MLQNEVFVALVSHHNEVLDWHNIGKSFVCVSDERATSAEDVQKLFREVLTTLRPKTSAYATSHNNTIAITLHTIFTLKFYKFTQR
jgi:hypothetical protein